MITSFIRPLPIPAARVFTHIVTLINFRTEEEACLVVQTSTDRFAEVLSEVKVQRALHGLIGFSIHEALPCEDLF